MTKLDSMLKSKHNFPNKDAYSQSYGFSSNHIRIWELDHKEGWVPESWRFWTVVLEKTFWQSLVLQWEQTSQS